MISPIETPTEIAAWLAVLAGLVLSGLGVRATFYFGEHERALKDTEGAWVVHAFWRTCLVITLVCLILTVCRMISLSFGTIIPVIQLVQALAVIWLLTKPYRLMRTFQSREGRQ